MITDLEIYRAANQLVKRYGHDAEFEAAKQADAMLEAGTEFAAEHLLHQGARLAAVCRRA